MMTREGLSDQLAAVIVTGSDSNGGRGVGDMQMTKGSTTLPMKRPSSGASRDCNDNQVQLVPSFASKVRSRGIKLSGNSRRKQALAWFFSEQLKSVRGWMKKVDKVEADNNVRRIRRNVNNVDAGPSRLVLNVDEARALKKAFDACMILLGKISKHMSSEMHDAKILQKWIDLGFIKTQLKTNVYKTPSQFAGDMRLKFNSAMTCSPAGHIVHEAAKGLLEIFDDRWVNIETEYVRGVKLAHHAMVIPHQQQQATRQGA